ncbi:uncharacterized protein HaLaN_26047, partial [Haematococcus lacustris]
DPGGPGQAALGSRKFSGTPDWLRGGQLHGYQLEGLNWLFHKWSSGDNMGLGKTVQAIALLAALHAVAFVPRPSLLVVPLSTLRNWEREFKTWAPHLNVVTLNGNAAARKTILEHELLAPPVAGQRKTEGVAERVNYEMLVAEAGPLCRSLRLEWEVLVVDEGHRLKNKDSRLFQELKAFKPKFKLLLTGTPLQNNLGELFMLMHFLEPAKFESQEQFEQQFSDLAREQQVSMLHTQLEPHLLRRMKKDVLRGMPPKQEQIVRVELTAKQKEVYKQLLARHYPLLARGASSAGATSTALKNVVSMLHTQLEPHLLRRMKKDVLRGMPPKQEQIVRVELTAKQKEVYKQLLARHYPLLARGASSAGATSTALKNVVMQLRKCCVHAAHPAGAAPAAPHEEGRAAGHAAQAGADCESGADSQAERHLQAAAGASLPHACSWGHQRPCECGDAAAQVLCTPIPIRRRGMGDEAMWMWAGDKVAWCAMSRHVELSSSAQGPNPSLPPAPPYTHAVEH